MVNKIIHMKMSELLKHQTAKKIQKKMTMKSKKMLLYNPRDISREKYYSKLLGETY